MAGSTSCTHDGPYLSARVHHHGQVHAICGRQCASQWRVSHDATRVPPAHDLGIPARTALIGAGLPLLALRAGLPEPGSFLSTSFYEFITSMIEKTIVHRTTVDALKAFNARPDVLIIHTHNASVHDVLLLFPAAERAGWQKQPSKSDIRQWRYLIGFEKVY